MQGAGLSSPLLTFYFRSLVFSTLTFVGYFCKSLGFDSSPPFDLAYILYSIVNVPVFLFERLFRLELSFTPENSLKFPCGDGGTRTPGFCLAKAALSRLSYIPLCFSLLPVGHSGLEPETSPLSEARSNQLS